jgi:superfamily II DNA or RNA helicase
LAALQQVTAGATLGLTATYSRQFDEAGTAALLQWFGPVLRPVIGLAEAMLLGLLVPYDYRLHTVKLDEGELARYAKLTDRIRTTSAMEKDRGELSSNLKMLLILRARILKKATAKVGATLEILTETFRSGERWLVYCDDTEQLTAVVELGVAQSLPVMEFRSGMTGDRRAALESLERHGGIIVAIRCLDEGVDIPSCDNALIVASSSTSREYIQRRGRILRPAPDKTHAVVHDLLLVDETDGILARSEAVRALEFARLARNPAAWSRIGYHLALSHDIDIGTDVVVEDGDEAVDES